MVYLVFRDKSDIGNFSQRIQINVVDRLKVYRAGEKFQQSALLNRLPIADRCLGDGVAC